VRIQTSESKKTANLDKLIAIEWDILRDLKKMLHNPELSTGEKTRVANALAYHASVLNKLLSQKGESSQFSEATLGDFIKDVRLLKLIRRDFKAWTKRLSLKK
jgi:hypothetical protein